MITRAILFVGYRYINFGCCLFSRCLFSLPSTLEYLSNRNKRFKYPRISRDGRNFYIHTWVSYLKIGPTFFFYQYSLISCLLKLLWKLRTSTVQYIILPKYHNIPIHNSLMFDSKWIKYTLFLSLMLSNVTTLTHSPFRNIPNIDGRMWH